MSRLGRFILPAEPKGLERRPSFFPRTIPDRVPNTAVVSVVDLELDDGNPRGNAGLKRALSTSLARTRASRAVR